jgi:hypothetical protein
MARFILPQIVLHVLQRDTRLKQGYQLPAAPPTSNVLTVCAEEVGKPANSR